MRGALAIAIAVALTATGSVVAQERPWPDVVGLRYGPHERHVIDIWQARAAGPAPLVVYFHGGGFRAGDRRTVPIDLLEECLAAGLSVASVEYRLSHHAIHPGPMLDAARAVAHLRSVSVAWRIDPGRLAVVGDEVGGTIALWLAMGDDHARPDAEDPIARCSTRVGCAATLDAPTALDPRRVAHPILVPFFGLAQDERWSGPASALYRDASPIDHASADDPPVLLLYSGPDRPRSRRVSPDDLFHPAQGRALADRLARLGVQAETRGGVDRSGWGAEAASFVARTLGR